jgi:hypothetical protein
MSVLLVNGWDVSGSKVLFGDMSGSDITPEADNRDVKQGSGAAVRKR